LAGKLLKQPFGRLSCRWEDDTNINIIEIIAVMIEEGQDRFQRHVCVSTSAYKILISELIILLSVKTGCSVAFTSKITDKAAASVYYPLPK
jgi:hypothetical protein